MIILKNYTNIADDKIRQIIKFVRPAGIARFDVRISNSKSIFQGRAYINGSAYHKTPNPFIVVRITKQEDAFPFFVHYKSQKRTRPKLNPVTGRFELVAYNTGTGGYIDHLLLSREETIVHVIAHELRHMWQKNHKKGKVWRANGRYSDRDADAYAIRKTREWRRKNSENVALTEFEEWVKNPTRSPL
jgi:hypothetical protein